jgi:hypothetical protein
MAREAAQLRLMTEVGRPQVCAVAGAACEVLFTELAPSPTLAGSSMSSVSVYAPVPTAVDDQLSASDGIAGCFPVSTPPRN